MNKRHCLLIITLDGYVHGPPGGVLPVNPMVNLENTTYINFFNNKKRINFSSVARGWRVNRSIFVSIFSIKGWAHEEAAYSYFNRLIQ